jgi:CheY-like chemotaxis protein
MNERAAAVVIHPRSEPLRCILVVEDDAEIREAMQCLLEEDGYATAVARNGLEALEWLRANGRPELILLDLMMPVMDGRTFLGHLRDSGPMADVPVMVMSAQSRAAVPGAVAVVEKPFDVEAFLSTLRRYCRAPRPLSPSGTE